MQNYEFKQKMNKYKNEKKQKKTDALEMIKDGSDFF